MEWVLKRLGADARSLEELEGRLQIHVANVRFMFERRMKNITLIVGLVLCLGLNINAFTIWDTLYNNSEVRAKFAAEGYVDTYAKFNEQIEELDGDISKAKDEQGKKALEEQREALAKQLGHLRGEIGFGMGKVWQADGLDWWPDFPYEFLGSLLTGILVSIGAPYWHELLRALARLRGGKQPGGGG
jgi:hypothetical protein